MSVEQALAKVREKNLEVEAARVNQICAWLEYCAENERLEAAVTAHDAALAELTAAQQAATGA